MLQDQSCSALGEKSSFVRLLYSFTTQLRSSWHVLGTVDTSLSVCSLQASGSMENTSTSDTTLIHKGGSVDTQGTSSRAPGPGAKDGGGESRGCSPACLPIKDIHLSISQFHACQDSSVHKVNQPHMYLSRIHAPFGVLGTLGEGGG